MNAEELKQQYQTLMKLEQAKRELDYNRESYTAIMESVNTSHNIKLEGRFNMNVSTGSIITLLDAEMLLIQDKITAIENELNLTV